MAQSLQKACQGLGESQPKGSGVLAPRLNPPHAQKTLQSGLKSPDGLLDKKTTRGRSLYSRFDFLSDEAERRLVLPTIGREAAPTKPRIIIAQGSFGHSCQYDNLPV